MHVVRNANLDGDRPLLGALDFKGDREVLKVEGEICELERFRKGASYAQLTY